MNFFKHFWNYATNDKYRNEVKDFIAYNQKFKDWYLERPKNEQKFIQFKDDILVTYIEFPYPIGIERRVYYKDKITTIGATDSLKTEDLIKLFE